MTVDELHASQQELDKRLAPLEAADAGGKHAGGAQTKTSILPSIVLPIAGTVAVAIITTGAGCVANINQVHETARARQAQAVELLQTQIAATRQQSVDNGRAAATMYFSNLADLRGKDNLSPGEKKRFARDLEIVAAISGNDDLKEIMTRASRDAAVSVRNQGAQQSDMTAGAATLPSTSLSALPDLARTKAAKDYVPADFLAYPEIPATRWTKETEAFRTALTSLGFGTQRAEKIRPELAPAKNEVRYYKPEHAAMAGRAAAQLTGLFHQRFVAKQLGGGATLPNGVMEFWLGTSPDPA